MRALCLLLLLAGCDSLTPPDRTNPYDPEFDGERIVTQPSDLHVVASTATEITLAWTDNSSFESGMRVERFVGDLLTPDAPFEVLATLAPDATTYTDTSIGAYAPRHYRVVAFVAGGRSPFTEALRLTFPVDRVAISVDATRFYRSVDFSPDGQTLYGNGFGTVEVVDARSGALNARIAGADGVAGFLADGSVALYAVRPAETTVQFYGTSRPSVVLPGPYPGCQATGVVRVSADARRAVASCGGRQFGVWEVGSASGPATFSFPESQSGGDTQVVGFSGDGGIVLAGAGGRVFAFDTGTRQVLWSQPGFASPGALRPDGQRVLVTDAEQVVLRDVATGNALARASAGYSDAGRFSADGSVVAFGTPGISTGTQIARAADLAVIARFPGVVTRDLRPTPSGAVWLADGASYRSDIVRWERGRSWVVSPL